MALNYLSFNAVSVPGFLDSALIGILLPLGSLLGDTLKSFFKRQFDIPPGRFWVPFDQIDWLLGGIACTYPLIKLDMMFIVGVVTTGCFLHVIVKKIGFMLHLQEEKI
uniref:CDP-archaeol synthase n=1 Tax=candidate division WWE3 bacterium TaxID=2053526 RepID=A0A7C4TKA9_UNCKA